MTIVEDPFATVEEAAIRPRIDNRKKIITAGRYRLPNRDGSEKTGGWMRVTKLVSSYADQYGLRIWEVEQVMTALHLDEVRVMTDLRETIGRLPMMPKGDRRGAIEDFLDRCKVLSGGSAGAAFGNARHALVEADHLNLPQGILSFDEREHLSLYRSALVRNELRALEGMQERRVLVEELEAIGTLDNILEDLRTRVLHIADLKTQKTFWSWLEIAAQLACYAHAVAIWIPTDPDDQRAGRWVDMPEVSREVAHVLWMPKDHPSGRPAVDVYEVDIVAGWKTAQLAREITIDRSGGKSASKPRAWLRKAPPATAVEQYAARFAACNTMREGQQLVAECQRAGVWCDVLADEARRARQRIEKFANP